MPHAITNAMQECIDECLRCHSICLEAVGHCLELGGKHAEQNHIATLLDCAEICQTSANFMLRDSESHNRICAVCAEICRKCEEECRRLGDDELMRRCADACRECATSCERMAAGAA